MAVIPSTALLSPIKKGSANNFGPAHPLPRIKLQFMVLSMASMTTLKGETFDRSLFESVLKRRFFFTEAFEIYPLSPNFKGDNRGLFDYGPPGCALSANLVDTWRKHFVLEENMLEVDCPVITPELVLETSGHVDKFSDWMCKDPAKGDYLRADHLIDNYDGSGLAELIKRLDIRNPNGNGEVLPPIPFNLMFKSTAGPNSAAPV
ncbi:glycyl-trna synthetase protein [Diaporthe amygdali]|uniref:glycyl-trna synthetase protein n=1 Tax=Phomopsis amygdali TaxID=1214568 RepID=UPI0022FE9607|nr:glycyl-trna synthetase protein [Diaporthe amygdali]KAJ0123877.1 glycyl-trna synthetase protein [Diaporthe amygdali]